jgi:hypothetical protein
VLLGGRHSRCCVQNGGGRVSGYTLGWSRARLARVWQAWEWGGGACCEVPDGGGRKAPTNGGNGRGDAALPTHSLTEHPYNCESPLQCLAHSCLAKPPLNKHGSLPGRPHPFDCILECLPECLRIFMVFMAVWYVRVHGRPLSVDLGLYMSCMWLNRAGLGLRHSTHAHCSISGCSKRKCLTA